MNYKLKNFIKKKLFISNRGHKIYTIFGDAVRRKRAKLSDREYVERAFYENTGKRLDLDNPKNYNDKLLWLSLNERIPMKTRCADKYLVRSYVEECGFGNILNNLLGVYDSVNEIPFNQMPELFFIKTNHDSGTYALIDKRKKNYSEDLERIESALSKNYYFESREWQYKDIVPKVLCEEYLYTDDPCGLIDYRFFCFSGKIGFIAVDIGTTSSNGEHSFVAKRNIYNVSFEPINATLKREHFDPKLVKKPEHFDEMCHIAEVLSKPFSHVRVDLYNIHGRIVFGEMTFCNGGGMQLLEPEEFNLEIGKLINVI